MLKISEYSDHNKEEEEEEKFEFPNEKNKGLRVLIEFNEEERTILENNLEIRSYTGTGQIIINNPAKEESLWSTKLKLTNFDKTNLQEEIFQADDLGPNSKWNMNYRLTNSMPIVKIEEQIDTDFNTKMDPDFSRDDLVMNEETTILFMLTVTNLLNEPMAKIVVEKQLPDLITGKPQFLDYMTSEPLYEPETKLVTWNLNDVQPAETIVLKVYVPFTPQKTEAVDAGQVQVSYSQMNRGNITNIEPELTTLTSVIPSVEAVEGDVANTWDCRASFEGNKEFQVLLEEFSVIDKKTEDSLFKSGILNKIINVEEEWSNSFIAQSEKMPKLKPQIQYRVPWDVKRLLKGTITKESRFLPVIDIKVEKTFTPPSVPSYARTPVTATIKVMNVGSAPIFHLRIFDHLPPYCSLEPDSITIKTENFEAEIVEHVLEDVDLQHRRKLTIDGRSIKIDNPLLPANGITIIEYKLVTVKPVPGKDYHTPIMVHAFSLPAARTPKESRALVEETDPILKIVYTKRAIRTGKVIIPRGPGKFRIKIRVQNLGGVDLEQVELKHMIPPNYQFQENLTKLLSFTENVTSEGTEISWIIPRIAPEEKLEVEYDVTGEGEFDPDEPEVHVPEIA